MSIIHKLPQSNKNNRYRGTYVDNEATVYASLAATWTAVTAWAMKFFINRTVKRIDAIESDMDHIKHHCIESGELSRVEDRITKIINNHSEDIKRRVEHTNNRVDELFSR